MLCPRWDSNCIPALANTGNPRKHAESGAVRPISSPVRSENVAIVNTPYLSIEPVPGQRPDLMAFDHVDPGTAPTSRLSIQRHSCPHKSFSRVTQQFWILSCDSFSGHLVSPRDAYCPPLIEIRQLFPRDWEPSQLLVDVQQRRQTVVVAARDEPRETGRTTTVRLSGLPGHGVHRLQARRPRRSGHPRRAPREEAHPLPPQSRTKPDGLGRHGGTCEHLHGKQLIMDWARNQHHILPGPSRKSSSVSTVPGCCAAT